MHARRGCAARRGGVHIWAAAWIALAAGLAGSDSARGGNVVYADNFDVDTSANWTAISSGDSSVQFAFDYSALGIPPAPGSATTRGLRLRAHLQPVVGVHAVTLASHFQIQAVPPEGYVVAFEAWQNHTNLTVTPNGGGSTQYVTCGIGHNRLANNFAGNPGPTGPTPETGSGAWFTATGDEGALRDFIAFKNGTEQLASLLPNPYFAGTQNGRDAPYSFVFPQVQIGSINGGALATAQGLAPGALTPLGSTGFAWHHWEVRVNGAVAVWSIDGLPIARLVDGENGSVPLAGSLSLGYMDIFNSVTGLTNLHFGLIDNLTATVIPEPAAPFAVGAVLLIGRSRRRQGRRLRQRTVFKSDARRRRPFPTTL